jgi:hypothetical protein
MSEQQLTMNTGTPASPDAQSIFSGNFTVWSINSSGWNAKARLMADDLDLNPVDIDTNVKLGHKDMLPERERVTLNQSSGQVQSFMKLVSRPFFGRALYAVPDNKLIACQQGLTRIREAQRERVEDFLTRYLDVMKSQILKHPNLANAQWPTAQEIRSSFDVRWTVFQVSAADARPTDPQELVEAKQQFKQDLTEAYEELKDEILGESYKAMLENIDLFNERLTAGEKLTETNFKKPRQVIEQYLSIASVFDLPQVRAKVEELSSLMDGTNAKTLRERPLSAKIFTSKLSEIGEALTTLTGYSKDGRLKRKLNLDTEEEPAAANG